MVRFKYWSIAIVIVFLATGKAQVASAQLGSAGDMIRGGQEDANTLFHEYLKPFAHGLGANLNSGWFNRARPNGVFNVDIAVRMGIAMVPITDRNFFVDELDLQHLQRIEGPPGSPTAFGEKTAGPVMALLAEHPETGELVEITRFTLPGGTGSPYMPAPVLQASVGVGKGTELSVRYMPETTVRTVNVGMSGLGIKHSLNQWFSDNGEYPVDFSIQIGYTKLHSSFSLDVRPQFGTDIYNPYQIFSGMWNGQAIHLNANGFTANILAGRDFSILSVFAGVGFQTSGVNIKSAGSYPVTIINPLYDPEDYSAETRLRRIDSLRQPVDLAYEGANNLHTTGGLNLRLAFINVSGSFVMSRYTMANIGVGLRF